MNEKQKDGCASVLDNFGNSWRITIASASYGFVSLDILTLVLLYIFTFACFLNAFFIRRTDDE